MIDELSLVEGINTFLQTDGIERDVSLGLLCKALILNGLGFTQRTLYMVPSFFEYRIRQQLDEKKQTVPNQLGKQVKKSHH